MGAVLKRGMRRQAARRLRIGALAMAVLAASGPVARAQSIEPRTLSPAPVGVNFLVASYSQRQGGLSLDPALTLTDPQLSVAGPTLWYARSLDLLGTSGKVDLVLPYESLSGTAHYLGQPVGREVSGLEDPLLRLSAILYGEPAMTPAEFKAYQQDLLVGLSLQVSAPLGQFDASKLLNVGQHRWSFKPELAISKAFGSWDIELQTAATVYTDNDDFFGGRRRAEAPVYSDQIHLLYNWRSGAWGSIDALYFTGGRETIDGARSGLPIGNWRLGATFAMPVTTRHSIKLYGSDGVWARTHNSFSQIGIAWQYRWGGGL
jgi:hypothetical protein